MAYNTSVTDYYSPLLCSCCDMEIEASPSLGMQSDSWPPCFECEHSACRNCFYLSRIAGSSLCRLCRGNPSLYSSSSQQQPTNHYSERQRQGLISVSQLLEQRRLSSTNGTADFLQRPASYLGQEHQEADIAGSKNDDQTELLESYHQEVAAIIKQCYIEAHDTLKKCEEAAMEKIDSAFCHYSQQLQTPKPTTSFRNVEPRHGSLHRQQKFPADELEVREFNSPRCVPFDYHLQPGVSPCASMEQDLATETSETRRSETVLLSSAPIRSVGEVCLTVGKVLEGHVTETKSPGAFYVQLVQPHMEKLQEIQVALNAGDCSTDYKLLRGELCAAKFMDNIWYRALVESSKRPGSYNVFFVDFGNRETVTSNCVKEIDSRFIEFPAQAVLCSLARIKPPRGQTTWSKEARDVFSELTSDKKCRVKVVHIHEGTVGKLGQPEFKAVVELFIDDVNVADILTDRLLASSTRKGSSVPSLPDSSHLSYSSTNYSGENVPGTAAIVLEHQEVSVNSQGRREVLLVAGDSPGDFGLRYLEVDPEVGPFHFALGNSLHNANQLSAVEPGQICAVYNESLGYHCRGRVLERDPSKDKVTVYLLDFGSVLVTQLQHLKQLPEFLGTEPPMAFRCQLAGVQPAGGAAKWTRVSSERFTDVVKRADKLFAELVEGPRDGEACESFISVRLYCHFSESKEDVCINDLLVTEGLALKKKKPKTESAICETSQQKTESSSSRTKKEPDWLPASPVTDKEFLGYPTWIDSEGHVYVQDLVFAKGALENISGALETAYANSQPEGIVVWKPGMPCIARFSQDGAWYRAKIVRVDNVNQKALVFFCDYGNSEELPFDELRCSLICTNFTIQAHKFVLDDVQPPGGSWNEDFAQKIRLLVVDRICTVKIREKGENPKVSLILEDGRTLRDILGLSAESVDGTLLESGQLVSRNGPSTYRAFDVPESTALFPVTVLEIMENMELILKPTKFPHISLDTRMEKWNQQIVEFENLLKVLEHSVSSFRQPDFLEPSMPCIVKDPVTGKWSRALINSISTGDHSIVDFVDTAGSALIAATQLREIPWGMCEVPCQAIRCRLDGLVLNATLPVADSLSRMKDRVKDVILWARFVRDPNLCAELFVRDSTPRIPAFSALICEGVLHRRPKRMV